MPWQGGIQVLHESQRAVEDGQTDYLGFGEMRKHGFTEADGAKFASLERLVGGNDSLYHA